MKSFFIVIILIFLNFFGNAVAQKPTEDFSGDVATDWFQLQIDIIPTTDGFTPPVSARALGYSGLTLYEAVVHGSDNYKSLKGKLNEFDKIPEPEKGIYNWAIVANTAMAEITSYLYSNTNEVNKFRIKELTDENYRKHGFRSDERTLKNSVNYGKSIAKAIYNYSKKDGGHESQFNNFPDSFRLQSGACMWVPVGEQKALQPYWGNNRTFIKGVADFHLPPPHNCGIGNSSILYVQALEVYSIGKNLTTEQKDIAKFWSDDPGTTFTPPGHGVSITNQLIKKEGFDLMKAAEVYCRVGIAASDAFISCWKCKYKFSMLRPVTFINTVIDTKWSAYLPNPPFPEYTSGHATVSGAIAMVLSDTFGYNYAFMDHSHVNKSYEPRSFENFWEYANEAAMSRLYGGIHYRSSNENGLINGKRIGQAACRLKLKI
jgi:hypothetical protein